eukprot:394198-Hanusia_phi.AAC.1
MRPHTNRPQPYTVDTALDDAKDATDSITPGSGSISSRDGSQSSQSSFGRGTKTGSSKRAKIDDALTPEQR